MANLIPVQYHRTRYPQDIKPRIKEIAGHFDCNRVSVTSPYSLHTEYSYIGRKFNTDVVRRYSEICRAQKRGIPMLWYSRKWAVEFADFIRDLTNESPSPHIVEIHPPFYDYTDLKGFMDNYRVFEERISAYFPDTIVLLENRCGTLYSGGKFVVSTIDQLIKLSALIDHLQVDLRFTVDIPQLLSQKNG